MLPVKTEPGADTGRVLDQLQCQHRQVGVLHPQQLQVDQPQGVVADEEGTHPEDELAGQVPELWEEAVEEGGEGETSHAEGDPSRIDHRLHQLGHALLQVQADIGKVHHVPLVNVTVVVAHQQLVHTILQIQRLLGEFTQHSVLHLVISEGLVLCPGTAQHQTPVLAELQLGARQAAVQLPGLVAEYSNALRRRTEFPPGGRAAQGSPQARSLATRGIWRTPAEPSQTLSGRQGGCEAYLQSPSLPLPGLEAGVAHPVQAGAVPLARPRLQQHLGQQAALPRVRLRGVTQHSRGMK